ncbi:hypothetical protein [Saccharomonospora saliphila]|uniref:hypothetical protein n=1 Tax=Saccharomonospora saliphila TaxID=369829 RepID=UPI0003803A1C|nr:hypothetical protein [Saccharomonospora saliphila]
MHGVALMIWVLVPMAIGSVVLAALRWRNRRLRAVILSAHLGVSLALIFLLAGPAEMWAKVLIPGMCLAVFRLAIALTELRRQQRPNTLTSDGESDRQP